MSVISQRRMTFPSIYGTELIEINKLKLIEKNKLKSIEKKSYENEINNILLNENYFLKNQSNNYYRPTWIEIDIGNICSNINLLKNYIGNNVHLMAVVKANAYGYGMIEIATAAIYSGATWLGVATLDEALLLRYNLTKHIPILVLGYIQPKDLLIASQFNITVTCVSFEWIQESIKYLNQPIDFHLKIDTGLNRLGLKTIDELNFILNIINTNKYFNFTGIFTHFASSGNMDDKTYFYKQLNQFKEYLKLIPNIENKIVHCANSDATLCYSEKPFFNMVRLGKCLLGPPQQSLNRFIPFQLKHTFSLYSKIILIKKLNQGEKVGYSGEYTINNKDQWVATLPIGYSDGWHQQYKTINIIIDNIKVPVIGRIAMDQLCILLPKYYPVGTKVTFIGQQNDQIITPYHVSIGANLPEAEILTSFSNRIPRVYVNNNSVIFIRNSILNSFRL